MTLNKILTIVCEYHGFSKKQVEGRSKKGPIAEARRRYYYLARVYCQTTGGHSLPWTDIAYYVGGRSHATAFHGFNTTLGLLSVEKREMNHIRRLERLIEGDEENLTVKLKIISGILDRHKKEDWELTRAANMVDSILTDDGMKRNGSKTTVNVE